MGESLGGRGLSVAKGLFPRRTRTRPLSPNRWQGKGVLVVGAARQGVAMARFLARRGAHVRLNDHKPLEALAPARQALEGLPVEWVTGGHPLEALEGMEAVFVSGGVPLNLPLIREAFRRGIPVHSDAHLFLEHAACPVVGITGSSGKTTTTTLLGRMARHAEGRLYRKVWVLGNIGPPLMDYVDDLHPDDLAVVELSSFQLEPARVSPEVAVVLNITPNHLDRHGTMEAYIAAKANILAHQRREDWAVLGREDPAAWSLRHLGMGNKAAFGLYPVEEPLPAVYVMNRRFVFRDAQGKVMPLFGMDAVQLRGAHNLQNVAAASLAGLLVGLSPEDLLMGVEGFTGVPHRLEVVLEKDGITWVNDSIATTPARAMAGIRAFAGRPIVLLAGGKDKNLPWEDWAAVVREHVDVLVVFGPAREKIFPALEKVPGPRPRVVVEVSGLRAAVEAAARYARPGSVVLLSPGATSFDEFPNFEVRGERFREWVREIVGEPESQEGGW